MNPARYEAFDYVALGHLHSPQNVGREDGTMRYSGSPLKYSKSELNSEKSVTLVELGEKGSVSVSAVPVKPKRDLRLARGLFNDLMRSGPEKGTEDDLFFIELTDEDDIPNAAARLRERFPGMLAMAYDNKRTRSFALVDAPDEVESKQPLQLMRELYQLVHNDDPMSDEAERFVQEILKKVEGMQA